MTSFELIYVAVALLLTFIYLLFMLFYIAGWMTLPEFICSGDAGKTKVSIIIPARNEEANIRNCLSDLLAQSYPRSLFEIIVVNDFSEDNTATVVQSFSSGDIRLFHLKDLLPEGEKLNSYKKKAIEVAVQRAIGELIITIDADCRVGTDWLKTIVSFYERKNCHMIVAPVLFANEKTFFEKFQSLDFIGLIGITGATLRLNFPTMCNGANLAFRKTSFEEVGGYKGADRVASGDDMLLMHKMAKQWKRGVLFLKNRNAVAETFPQRTWREFFRQRTRWTSKSTHYTDKKITVTLILAYLFNLSIPLTGFLTILHSRFGILLLTQISLKFITEFVLLSQVTKFFNRQRLLYLFLPSQLLHIFYVIAVGIAGITIKPTWKGRTVK